MAKTLDAAFAQPLIATEEGQLEGLFLGRDGKTRRAAHTPWQAIVAHLDALFGVEARGSTVTTEIRAGIVTWVTMSYIVIVNPMILSAPLPNGGSPISFQVACRATCLSAAVASGFVGWFANLPFGLAAGMGLNSYLRYGLIGRMGLSPQAALAACVVQGSLFSALAMSGVADRMQGLLPKSIKCAITVAIGIFQAFVGFQLMGLVSKSEETLVALGDISNPSLWLSMTSTLLVAALLVRRTQGALLIGICFTAVASQLLGLPNGHEGFVESGSGATLGSWNLPGLDFTAAFERPQDFGSGVLIMLFIVLFDTAGVQHGIGQQAGLLDEEGYVPGAKYAYLASGVGTGLGGLLGTSPVIIHNETAAGVQEGGRTGLTAIVTAILFLASPALVPLIELIPPEATAPCLVLVGAMMMAPVAEIDFSDLQVGLPAFLTICVTPMAYSISAGIFTGIASYVVLGVVLRLSDAAGRWGEDLAAGSQMTGLRKGACGPPTSPHLPPPKRHSGERFRDGEMPEALEVC